MALISMRQLLDHAAEHGYGVPAYNVNNLEQMPHRYQGHWGCLLGLLNNVFGRLT